MSARPLHVSAGHGRSRRLARAVVVAATLSLLVASCGARGDESTASTTTTTRSNRTTTSSTTAPTRSTSSTTSESEKFRPDANTLDVLVTNDDGVTAPGLAAMVDALRALPATRVSVAAPTGDRSTAGGSTAGDSFTAAGATTANGYPAIAVDGTPADAVAVALGEGGYEPDVVVAGVNNGPTLGTAATTSGTVGAARAAVDAGFPAIAVSQGGSGTLDFAIGARVGAFWVEAHRAQLEARDIDLVGVVNINVPACSAGTLHGLVEVPAATTPLVSTAAPNCSAATLGVRPRTDVEAFLAGWASQSTLLTDE